MTGADDERLVEVFRDFRRKLISHLYLIESEDKDQLEAEDHDLSLKSMLTSYSYFLQ